MAESHPLIQFGTVFNAVAVSTTTTLRELTPLSLAHQARSIVLEVNGGSTPDWTLDIQGSYSGAGTWHNIDHFRIDNGGGSSISNSQLAVNWTTAQYYAIPNPPPFVRLVGTRTGGTLTVYAATSSEPYPASPGAALPGTVVVNSELPAAAALADATATPTAPAVGAHLLIWNGTTWDRADAATVGTGILRVSEEFDFLNIAAGQATTVVKASAGILHSIVLNSAAAATNTTVVYDNATGVGTVIGRPAVVTATVPSTLIYDIKFANGLTIITATANGGDMTVCYR